MDKVLQIEILLERINILIAKSVCFDEVAINKLENLRHQIYYKDFDYETVIKALEELGNDLEQYD